MSWTRTRELAVGAERVMVMVVQQEDAERRSTKPKPKPDGDQGAEQIFRVLGLCWVSRGVFLLGRSR